MRTQLRLTAFPPSHTGRATLPPEHISLADKGKLSSWYKGELCELV